MTTPEIPMESSLISPSLAGIPETMLWTLYARAMESQRTGGILNDPQAVRIYKSIDYDFAGRFSAPNPLFALRAALIDGVLRQWLRRHPTGLIVSLGEGLETQSYRVDNGSMRWLSVDLPEAIRLRELFLAPGARFRHFSGSAIETGWIEQAANASEICIVAQGLLMYLESADVQRLLTTIAARFRGAELVFDVVPRELSESTLRGLQQSDKYTLPRMPFGLNRNEIAPTLGRWGCKPKQLSFLPYSLERKRGELVENLLDRIVPRRQRLASLVHVKL